MAENSDLNLEEDGQGEGMLTQADLDALIQQAAQNGEVEETWPSRDPLPEMPESFSEPAPANAAIGMVDLPSFDPPSASVAYHEPEPSGMGRVRDIPLEVTVELGRTRLLIRDILDLSSGSIIELDKIAGEPVDLFANGMLVARGEVIVIDDNFGVRVTEIITAADRSAPAKDSHAFAA